MSRNPTPSEPQLDSSLKNSGIYLFVILAIAALLRLLFLGTIPNGFFCDEASNAYDSYSMLETLRDQHGEFLPLFSRALDDYRESLYAFITIPFIKIFGLNEFSARVPAAVIGVLTVLAVYFLVKECFEQRTALIAALFLAISPWHIQFSRIAFRAILIPLLFSIGLLFFVKSFKRSWYLPLSGLLFGLSLYTYSAARVFVPLFLLGLVVIFWRHLWKHKKQTLLALVLFLLIFIPLFLFWISPEGMSRATGSAATGLTGNFSTLIRYYLSYFSPNFLFIEGDPIARHSPAKLGQLYYFEIITLPVGLFYLLRNAKVRGIFLLWLILYPVPAFLTAPTHALRAIAGVPLFATISAYGTAKLIELVRRQRRVLFASLFILLASLAILGKRYFIDYPLYTTNAWEYGMREAITYAENSSYDCIVMSNQIYLKKCGSLHIFVPFYTQHPPEQYQRSPISPATRKQLFLGETSYTLGRYSIISINNKDNLNSNCLFILDPDELEIIATQGYQWKEIHAVKDRRGIEYLKLVELEQVS